MPTGKTQSRGVYEMARKYGKAVVIMEPLEGGLLANPPESVSEILKEAEPERSAASWGIRFAANLDGVLVALSGMSDLAQMEDNISFMKDFEHMNDEQLQVMDKAREALNRIPLIPCTTCNYCAKVCPKNIYTLYSDLDRAAHQERWLVSGHGRKQAVECIRCGACEGVCPQHIQIREELQKAAELFGQKKE